MKPGGIAGIARQEVVPPIKDIHKRAREGLHIYIGRDELRFSGRAFEILGSSRRSDLEKEKEVV